MIRPEEIVELQRHCRQVDLSAVRKQYVDLVHNLRTTGIKVSTVARKDTGLDRRQRLDQ